MKYIDLFAGIGGFRLGIERAFYNKQTERIQQRKTNKIESPTRKQLLGSEPLCVYTNEWDKYAAQIYEKNFKTKVDTRDITTIRTSEIPDHDLLCAGFPCQAFSVAGKRKGFNDTRGTLFFDIARILKDKRPRYFILENVKGLLSHDSGKTFQTILRVLTDLGYYYQWQVLNSKNYGVPQNRERVFIVGHTRGTSRPKVFPLRESDTNDQTERKVMKVGKGKHQQDNFLSIEGLAPAVHAYESHGNGYSHHYPILSSKIRRLTPTECERLQGFPDGWTEGVSDTQRYKTLGNAVTVNVVEAVVERMIVARK